MVRVKSILFTTTAEVVIPTCLGFELWSSSGEDLTLCFGSDGDTFTLPSGSIYQLGIFRQNLDVSDLVVTGDGSVVVVYYY